MSSEAPLKFSFIFLFNGQKIVKLTAMLLCRSLGTVSYVDNPHDDEYLRHAVQFENTYQMEPHVRFPVSAITEILQDALADLKDKIYEPDECRSMTKSISDVSYLEKV